MSTMNIWKGVQMKNALFTTTLEFTGQDIINYLNMLKSSPIKIITLLIDIVIVSY